MQGLAAQWSRALLVFGVLLIFLANATGLPRVLTGQGTGNLLPAVLGSTEFLALLAVGLVLCVLLPVLRPIQASLLVLLATIPFIYLAYVPASRQPLVPMEYSLLTILMQFAVNVLAAYFSETRQRQKLLTVFGQYVPPEVVALIGRDPGRLSLESESREMSVMFCDIRNFSGISEELEPKQLSQMLNALFTPLTRIVYKNRGVIDKYMGDALMAFWGAPLVDPEHAAHAVAAAFEVQEALLRLAPPFKSRGWPAIRMGIGINTGVMHVGNMGSTYRMAYTVVGDAVNLAARLQDLTRVFHTRIIVGEGTRRAFAAPTYRELGLVQVRGKHSLVRIYEPCNPAIDPESTLVANMNRHNEALGHYYAREWDRATAQFLKLKEANPHDPLYDYYLKRIAEYRLNAPPEGWRGELRFSVK